MIHHLMNGLILKRVPRGTDPDQAHYDWFDIEMRDIQVGKTRCRIDPDRLIIYSIMIYPEYERNGYGKAVIDYFKTRYPVIVADRVRFTARSFWSRLGFVAETEDRYLWKQH